MAYAQGNVWPGDYSVDWRWVTDLQDVVRVVDGLWVLEGDTIRTDQTG